MFSKYRLQFFPVLRIMGETSSKAMAQLENMINNRRRGTLSSPFRFLSSRERKVNYFQGIRILKALARDRGVTREMSAKEALDWGEYTCKFPGELLRSLMAFLPYQQSVKLGSPIMNTPKLPLRVLSHKRSISRDLKSSRLAVYQAWFVD